MKIERSWLQLLIRMNHIADNLYSINSNHGAGVARLAKKTANQMRCTSFDVQSIYWAGLLHDVGKIGVPSGILGKPSSLTKDEWVYMRMHPVIGASIVKAMNHISQIAPVIHSHQERYNGSGYPDGLSGNQILLGARILAVADAYDAMTNDRVYRKALSPSEAILEIRESSGKEFDPTVVNAFLNVVEQ